MAARLLDGKRIADGMIESLRLRVQARLDSGKSSPGLAVVLVGDDPASAVYVRNKRRACARAGVLPFDFNLSVASSEAELHALVDQLNVDRRVHGILVQLPLPAHMNATALINRIDPRKDVDGFHAENVGRLALRQTGLRPCTPRGIITLLAHTDQPVRGRNAVVIGVSNHVGRPMLMEMLIAGTTTSACHRFTPRDELRRQVAQADIVIAAVGRPGLVEGEWVKPGAVIIDVGITRVADGTLAGDVEFAAARERASWITPVPGGVGPMTVATLIQNTVDAADALDGHAVAMTRSH